MELIRGQHNIRLRHHGCALTIGNFDGVHLGHQTIATQLMQLAEDAGLPSLLMIFEPQPREFFAGANAPARLTRLREKIIALQQTQLDRVLCLRFNHALAHMSPQAFVEQLLVKQLGARYIVVGDDFRFGHRGAGDVALLRSMGERCGFQVLRCDTYLIDHRRVSSSWIRQTLRDGDLVQAARLLGRRYSIQGRVQWGDQIGRTLGFPTANIALHRQIIPLAGVYAVRIQGLAPPSLPGVANIGKRPTLAGQEPRLEVHLFDFDRDIYGHNISVEFWHKLRGEQRFESLAALQVQIQRDAEQARALLTG